MMRQHKYPVMIMATLLMGVAGVGRGAAVVPWSEGFETNPVNSLISSFANWYGSDGTVLIQTNVVWTQELGTNAVVVPPGRIASNAMDSVELTNVWVDFFLTNSGPMEVGAVGAADIDTNMTVHLYVETNGFPVVWDPAGNGGLGNWLVCSTDYWGTSTTVFNTNAWMRFTFCADYSNKVAAIFLNQHLLKQGLRFINTNQTRSSRFVMDSGSSLTQYFDQVSALYGPTNMTVDRDNDGMADATEIQLYGSVGVRHWPVITVTQPAHGSIAPAGSFDVMPGSSTSFTFQADSGYAVSQVYTNGTQVSAFTGQDTREASWSWNTIIADGLSDGTVSAAVTYVARRYVPGDYTTITAAVAEAQAGDSIIVSNGFESVAGVTLSNGISLVGTNVTLAGGLTVNAGATAILAGCSNLAVSGTTTNDGLLVVSNGTVNLGTLVFGAGATVQVVNATGFVVDGVTFTGSVTLDANWKNTLVAQTPPFADNFERYPVGQALSGAGLFGWSTPASGGAVVQTNTVGQGSKAAEVPCERVLSNSLAPAAASNVWVEWTYREAGRVDETRQVVEGSDTSLALMMFINTNGYVTVYDPAAQSFRVLSNDVWGSRVDPLTLSDWPRLAVNLDYRTRKAAVLMGGRLLAQGVRFINTNQANCARLEWEAGTAGATYLDDVKVWTNATSVSSLDGDGDGISDAVEIDHSGDVFTWPRGSVFKIR